MQGLGIERDEGQVEPGRDGEQRDQLQSKYVL